VLTTGVALPDDSPGLARYVSELDAVGAAGLVVELGRRFRAPLPAALRRAADDAALPLVALRRETRFVAVTEAVHGRVLDAQLAELRASQEVHQTFTELTVEGAPLTQVLTQTARMAECGVVLEDLAHRVLAFEAAGGSLSDLLDGWELRSRGLEANGRTAWDERTGWLVTRVGARGQDWGRLVLIAPRTSAERAVVVAERAASALALDRLVARDRDSLERTSHRALLAAEPELRDLTDAVVAGARTAGLGALVGRLDDIGVGVLLASRGSAGLTRGVEVVATGLAAHDPPPVVGVGSAVEGLAEARRSLVEAAQVADAAQHLPARSYHRLEDARLRGLLHLLRDDARLQTFVERELGPVLSLDPARRDAVLEVLGAVLSRGGNKAAAAAALHLSRPALYDRLARLEQLLGTDLSDAESATSLHVAVLA